MLIHSARFVLRDFLESDRPAFVRYHEDPRYRRRVGFEGAGEPTARQLFDLFLAWQRQDPRFNHQLGVFERQSGRLCGCAGLRQAGQNEGTAVLGIELAPDHWGRYRMAIEVTDALIEHGFHALGLHTIVGRTASGNRRAERLARWFGARIVARRDGPEWMAARGWQEDDWMLAREEWLKSKPKR